MHTPSFNEDPIAQLPALKMLISMGYTYLSPEEALRLRGGKTSQVLLDEILRRQLPLINKPRISSQHQVEFTPANIEAGIQALKELPLHEGLGIASRAAYDLLTLGTALEQVVDGDKKSLSLRYIDWEDPANNVFHVTEEFGVMRSNSKEHYVPDLVLFVNGIPLAVMECKRPDKPHIPQAISQHLRNQQPDGIPPLYAYTQLLLALSPNEVRYATTGIPEKFWAHWEEKFEDATARGLWEAELESLKNRKLPEDAKNAVFGHRHPVQLRQSDELEKLPLQVTAQDAALYSLCLPQRLLELTFRFILFEDGTKKVARYQQYFAVKKAMKQLHTLQDGRRQGGVIWHTQGSGKSLTMVLLAQAIAMDTTIRNPKIVLVTDRTDLDRQLTDTFRKCGKVVKNAKTGQHLVELLQSKGEAIVTSVINKFETAVKKMPTQDSPDIFVLVDEGHRSQHGTFHIGMQKSLPHACFIAFTGTPLFKRDKNTLRKFGSIIDDYTVDKAVKDKAVVPLLYEGRHAFQDVNQTAIDNYFNRVAEPLGEYERADLKKKFSRADQLNITEQKINAIAWDISEHFRDNFQGSTPFKGQLVAQTKEAAIRYKNFLDDIGIVSSEVLISPPDDREGEESAYTGTSDRVKQFWKAMMNEHGNSRNYEQNIISRFRNQRDPEIIIVVDKLLTGFDEPKNIVLYLTRRLQGHTLLQAIARVNRIYPDKDYGYIIDYYGVLGELDEALKTYSSLEEFDPEDLEGSLHSIRQESEKLPQAHAELWDLFKTIVNKKDTEAYEQSLRDELRRNEFYEKLKHYARLLKMALSSLEFHTQTPEEMIARYKADLRFFVHLRNSVAHRYSDRVDYRDYEGQIQKLLDQHIRTDDVRPLTGLVNIFDKEKFEEEVSRAVGDAARADIIASRTARHISEKMEEDPAFYKRFSQLLQEAIRDYTERRISESEFLQRAKDIHQHVTGHTDESIPEQLRQMHAARAFYGQIKEFLAKKVPDDQLLPDLAKEAALAADQVIQSLLVVDWARPGSDVPKRMIHQMGDYFIDEVREKYQLPLSFEEIDSLAGQLTEIAKKHYPR